MSLGRLAPPRAIAEAERREARRTILYAIVAFLVAVVVTLTVLLVR